MRTSHRATLAVLLGLSISALGIGAAPLEAQSAKPAPAFVVIEFTVKNPDTFRTYAQQAPATIAQYGGKFTVRGAKPESVAGTAPAGPFIVLAFESAEQARKWATSPEYAALVPLRDQSADTRAFIVEGAAP